MGRWAQAARRGGGGPLVDLGEAPVMQAWSQFGSLWQANWTNTSNPLSFEVQVENMPSMTWQYAETLTATGISRSQVSNQTYDDIPVRGRVRAIYAGGASVWSDWVEAAVE